MTAIPDSVPVSRPAPAAAPVSPVTGVTPPAAVPPAVPPIAAASLAAVLPATIFEPGAARHRRAGRTRRAAPTVLLAAGGILLAWIAVLLAAPRVQVGPELHQVALFGHLAALILGFGAVLLVEWFGLLWLLGRRPLTAVVQTAQAAHLPIWLGLAGLAVTGVVLAPSPLTAAGGVKLGFVLLIALNGLYAGHVQRRLVAVAPAMPRPLLARAAGAAMISQLGWWTATVIGFLATNG